MIFPVLVVPANGQFAATLGGVPGVSATAKTRAEALAALEAAIEKRMAQGELVALEIGGLGLACLAGKYKDDPTLRDICAEAYQQRQAGQDE